MCKRSTKICKLSMTLVVRRFIMESSAFESTDSSAESVSAVPIEMTRTLRLKHLSQGYALPLRILFATLFCLIVLRTVNKQNARRERRRSYINVIARVMGLIIDCKP